MPDDETGGYIVRTQAEVATDDELEADQSYLRTIWNSIQDKAKRQAAPSVLYADLTLAQRVLRDMVGPDTGTILVDSRTTPPSLIKSDQRSPPSVPGPIPPHSTPPPPS